ncbi:Hypothetical protein FKW44_000830 [Caligus rogercresseyi]|uniref:Uncharacterized protein n=1 Tax=Caligus rogercresseyi TaxID=217165 RepID=A0A7T8KHZ2_CALRO|nr:Hypothetical protein FKW44_000830 [Caligus rogercresseyi]
MCTAHKVQHGFASSAAVERMFSTAGDSSFPSMQAWPATGLRSWLHQGKYQLLDAVLRRGGVRERERERD